MSGIVRAGAVVLEGGEPRVSSRDVAEHFGKRHDNVLRAIDRLEADAEDIMREGDGTAARFHALNFEAMLDLVQIGNGATREDRAFSISEGGFMVLTMGFTGREALRLKIAFFEEFRRMREALARNTALKAPGRRSAPPYAQNPEWTAFLDAWWAQRRDARVSTAELRALAEGRGLLPSLLSRCATERGRATALGHALNAALAAQGGPLRVRKLAPRNGYPTYRLDPGGAPRALGP